MVRIKQRYLLVQILYPTPTPSHSASGSFSAKAVFAAGPSTSSPSYLTTLHAPTPDTVNAQALLRHIRNHLAQLFGDAGAGLAGAGLSVKYWSNATSTLVLRCRREAVRWVWAAVTFVRSLPTPPKAQGQAGQECVMNVVRVSGTMKKIGEAVIAESRRMLGRVKGLEEVARRGLDGDREEGDAEEEVVDAMQIDKEDVGEAVTAD